MKPLLAGGRTRLEVRAAVLRYRQKHPRPKLPELSWQMSMATFCLLCFFAAINGCHHWLFIF